MFAIRFFGEFSILQCMLLGGAICHQMGCKSGMNFQVILKLSSSVAALYL